jgi:hypothetical protein
VWILCYESNLRSPFFLTVHKLFPKMTY